MNIIPKINRQLITDIYYSDSKVFLTTSNDSKSWYFIGEKELIKPSFNSEQIELYSENLILANDSRAVVDQYYLKYNSYAIVANKGSHVKVRE